MRKFICTLTLFLLAIAAIVALARGAMVQVSDPFGLLPGKGPLGCLVIIYGLGWLMFGITAVGLWIACRKLCAKLRGEAK